jgi:hypothetical protein
MMAIVVKSQELQMHQSKSSGVKSTQDFQDSSSKMSSTSFAAPGSHSICPSKNDSLIGSHAKNTQASKTGIGSNTLLTLTNTLIDTQLNNLRDLVNASVSFALFLTKLNKDEYCFQTQNPERNIILPQDSDTFQKILQIHKTNWMVIIQRLKDAKLDGIEILPCGWEQSFINGDQGTIAEFLVFWVVHLQSKYHSCISRLAELHPEELKYVLSGQVIEYFASELQDRTTPTKVDVIFKQLQSSAPRNSSAIEQEITPERIKAPKNNHVQDLHHSRQSLQELLAAIKDLETTNRLLRDDLICSEREVMGLSDELKRTQDENKYLLEQDTQKESEIHYLTGKLESMTTTLQLLNEKSGKSAWQAQIEAAEERAEFAMADLDIQVKQFKDLERKYYEVLKSNNSKSEGRGLWTSEDMDAQKNLESKTRILTLENQQLNDKLQSQDECIHHLTEKLMIETTNNSNFAKQFSEINSVAVQREIALSKGNQDIASLRAEINQLKDSLEEKDLSMRRLELELSQIVQNGHHKNTEVLQKIINMSSEPQGNINLVHVCKEMSRLHLMETELLHSFLHDFVVAELTGTPLQELVESKLRTGLRRSSGSPLSN